MSECEHDKRFTGVFLLPKEDHGCVACALERLTVERDTARKQVIALEFGGGSIQNEVVANNQRLQSDLADAEQRFKFMSDQVDAKCKIIKRQQSRIELLEAVVEVAKDAKNAIESLDEDALGYGQSTDGQGDVYHWPLRDELLSKLKEVLATVKEKT